jgi:cytochrome c oxidase subunit IV
LGLIAHRRKELALDRLALVLALLVCSVVLLVFW